MKYVWMIEELTEGKWVPVDFGLTRENAQYRGKILKSLGCDKTRVRKYAPVDTKA